MSIHFPTLTLVLSLQVLGISALLVSCRPRSESWLLGAFCASIAVYSLFHLARGHFGAGFASVAGPVLANESLPAVLLLAFITKALFGRLTRGVQLALAIPLLEAAVRISLVAATDINHDKLANGAVYFGQAMILVSSTCSLYMIAVHRGRYFQATSDNRIAFAYAYISPALLAFAVNLGSIALLAFSANPMAGSKWIIVAALVLGLLWPLSFLVLGPARFTRVSVVDEPERAEEAEVPSSDATTEVSKPANKGLTFEAVDRFVRHTDAYLEPELSLERLARRLGTNRAYLSRMVNSKPGQNFSSYINGLRVEHAKRLLEESPRSILDIAFASGFSSKATFNRVFRSLASVTPSQYRATLD